MATWHELLDYMRTNEYTIMDETHNMVRLMFQTQGGRRSQMVYIWHLTVGRGAEEWIQIESPFGEFGKVDLSAALQRIGSTICGGMAMAGNLVTFRHSVPLENLDVNEFESPLALVTTVADKLESDFNGDNDLF
jgi:hypothetical protein